MLKLSLNTEAEVIKTKKNHVRVGLALNGAPYNYLQSQQNNRVYRMGAPLNIKYNELLLK